MGATRYLDDGPTWWQMILLPALVAALVVGFTSLKVWDWCRGRTWARR